jgi:hypothetical protein
MSDNKINTAGCVAFLLAPALSAVNFGFNAWVGHKIWSWYPPFGHAAPSTAELFAILCLLSIAKGFDVHQPANPDVKHPVWVSFFGNLLKALFILVAVSLFRWWTS